MTTTTNVQMDEDLERAQRHMRAARETVASILTRGFVGASLVGFVIAPTANAVEPWELFLAALVAVWTSSIIVYAYVFYEHSARLAQTCRRYGLRGFWGVAEVQVREVRILNAPANVGAVIAAALRRLHPDVQVERTSEELFTASRGPDPSPGQIRGLPSVVRVEILANEGGNLRLSIRSVTDATESIARQRMNGHAHVPQERRLARLFARPVFDHGRSIENVEEFQIALKQLIEGVADPNGGQQHGG